MHGVKPRDTGGDEGDTQLRRGMVHGAHMTVYNPDIALRVVEAIAEGTTITELTVQPGMPSRATFYRWLTVYPELKKAYEAARELSAQSFEEEALDMARKLKGTNDFTASKVRMYEVAMAQLRWSAARRDPKRYGQKTENSFVVPIQINTTLDMGIGDGAMPKVTDAGDSIYNIEARVGGDIAEEVEEAFVLPETPGEIALPRRQPSKPHPKGHLPDSRTRAKITRAANKAAKVAQNGSGTDTSDK